MGHLKSLIPILIALVVAVAGSLLVYKWIQNQKGLARDATRNAAQDIAQLVVAKVDLPAGTKITPELIKNGPYLMRSAPQGHFTKMDDVNGRVVVSALKQGEPVVEHRLAPTSVKAGGISSLVQPGKRALAVKGDKIIGLSGFISPGNRVDVLVTIKDPDKDMEKTKTVLENIPVLASGTQMVENEKGQPSPVDEYTLEVTPEEGEKLAMASTKGKLQFMLRNATDYESIRTKGVTIPQMLASLSSSARPSGELRKAPPQKKAKPKSSNPNKSKQGVMVEILKGLHLSKETY